ncbi:hypothetical protein [Photobacterium nomapromontoriensis]|uniref:hypothetical protein n=1 Tax=Photobacterium nomapromontoriensis TaxID=2910237 RepID=UPI003D10C69A
MKTTNFLIVAAGIISSMPAWAENTIYITPYIGYSFSNSITDENGTKIAIDDDLHYALSIETDLSPGRAGLFISHQPNTTAYFDDSSFTYVHFQSSLQFKPFKNIDTYFGASLGTTIVDAKWTDDDLLWSGGLQAGASYHIANNLELIFEGRWLANLIDSDTTTRCTLPTGSETCNIKIESKWLSQFQTNLGLRYSF